MLNLRLFDSNCMIGGSDSEAIRSFPSSGILIDRMNDLGIEEALVYASYAKYNSAHLGNGFLEEAVGNEKRLHRCYVLTPEMQFEETFPKKLAVTLKANKVRAVRVFPAFNGFSPTPWLLGELLKLLNRAHIVLLIDSCISHWNDPYDWSSIQQICDQYKDLPIVLVRHGMRSPRSLFPLMRMFDNLFIETSYFQSNRGLKEVSKIFGSNRLIFGTGMPVYDPNLPIAGILFSGLSEREKTMVAGENLRSLLAKVDLTAL